MVKTSPSNAGVVGSIPGWGAKIPHASWPKNQNIKRKQYGNKFNKNFKKWSTSKKKILKKKKGDPPYIWCISLESQCSGAGGGRWREHFIIEYFDISRTEVSIFTLGRIINSNRSQQF